MECEFVIDTRSNLTIVTPDVVKKAAVEKKDIPTQNFLRTVARKRHQ